MPRTEAKSLQIKDGQVKRQDLDTTTSGQAVVTKIVAGNNVTISSTGADAGTGDVTINVDITGGAGGITKLNNQTDTEQTLVTGSTGTDFTISSATGIHTFNLPSASTTARGLVTTTAQSFSGLKTFNNGVDLNSQPITSVLDPVNDQDAATKKYVDDIAITAGAGVKSINLAQTPTQTLLVGSAGTDFNINTNTITGSHTFNIPDASISARGLITIGAQTFGGLKTFQSGIDLNNQRITNLATPTASNDAATKAYVDQIVFPLDVKNSVRAATTSNISLSGLQLIDGVTLANGDRVLVKNQALSQQNGIYSASTGAWIRTQDANTNEKVTANMFVFVSEGTTQADTQWVLTSNDPISLDATALTFSQFGANLSISSIPDASPTQRGLVSTTSQSFAGTKSFNDGVRTTAIMSSASSLSPSSSQGAYLLWNVDGGGGRTHFVNNKGAGGGGFSFSNTPSTPTVDIFTIDAVGNGYFKGNTYINNSSPTLYLQDTDHRSAMIHVNSNIFYVLRGSGVNSGTWAQFNGVWPLEINLEDNNAKFGGTINALNTIAVRSSDGNLGGILRTTNESGTSNDLEVYASRGAGELFFSVNDGTKQKAKVSSSGNFHILQNLRIGSLTSSPSYQLHLTADSAFKPSTNTWTTTSDERLKTNIVTADLDRCYEIVRQLPLKRYTWRDDVYSEEEVKDRSKLGWIAQDVESFFPKAVGTDKLVLEYEEGEIQRTSFDENGEPKIDENGNIITETVMGMVEKTVIEDCKNLNSDQIYAVLYGAVQKLIQKVSDLELEVSSLKKPT